MGLHRLLKLFIVCVIMASAGLAHADSCSYKTKIRYADGQEGCLSDLPLASQKSKAWSKSIESVAQAASNYIVVAASNCNATEVFASSVSTTSMWRSQLMPQVNNYIQACPQECDCTVVVDDGNVKLPKNLALALGRSVQDTPIATQTTKEQDPKNTVQLVTQSTEGKEKARPDEQAQRRDQPLKAEAEALKNQRNNGPVSADSCSSKTKIRYADGQEGCLSDLPLASQKSNAWGKSIDSVALYSIGYMIVAATSCNAAEIFTNTYPTPSGRAELTLKVDGYIQACAKACDCKVVIDNGNVLVPKNLAMALGRSDQGTTLAAQQALEQEQKNSARLMAQETERQEKARLDAQAQRRDQQFRAEAEALKNQRKFEEEARIQEQLRLAQETKAKEDARLAREAADKERTRLAEVQRSNALAQADQEERRKDRDLLQQLSAELARLRAEAAAAALAATQPPAAKPPAAALAPEPVYANRKALVIGNDSYKSVTKLENAREDARLMAKSLGDVGYQVTLKMDLTEKEMKAALRGFKNQVEAGDEVAIFYAGHGVQLANSNYLVPIDVAGQDEDQLRDEGIALQRLLDDMAEKKVKFTLAMIDACRDNPFKSNGRALGGGTRGMAPTTAATGQMIVFSAGSGQQALDKLNAADKDKNGLFTRVFAREMLKPNTSVDKVVRTVRAEVVKLARSVGHEQVPAIYDQVVGEFYFRK